MTERRVAPDGVIVVFAKAPRPGLVKTRMTPPLAPGQAADLYAALLRDVLGATARFAEELGLEALVAVHPRDACEEIARAAPAAFRVVPQRGPDLGRRMGWAAAEAGARGARRILLRGSDSPLLGLEVAARALAALEEADVVLSPDRDGGYNLVGLRRPVPGLFDHPMSTASVLADTIEEARRRGLHTTVVEGSSDLDTVADLRWLDSERRAGRAGPCPRTLAWLDEHEIWRLMSG